MVRHRLHTAFVALAFAARSAPVFAVTDAYWLNALGGDWGTAGNWSTSPIVPANGVPSSASTYHAIFETIAVLPYTVSMPNLNLALDQVSIRDRATLEQSGGLVEIGQLDIDFGRYLLTGGGTLRARSIRATDWLELTDALVENAKLSGTVVIHGDFDGPSRLSDFELQDATIYVDGHMSLLSSLNGVGRIELLNGRVASTVPISVGPSVAVVSLADSDTSFGSSQQIDFFGDMQVDGLVGLSATFHNFGSIQVHHGGKIDQISIRQQDDTLPGKWWIDSGGQIAVATRAVFGSAADITFHLRGPTNRPLIDTPNFTANGVARVELDPSYMPRSDQPIRLWRAQRTNDGAFRDFPLEDLPRGFAWDSSQLASDGKLSITGPAPRRVAFTEFDEAPVNATSHVRSPGDSELGFESLMYLNDGGNPAAGVNSFPGERALSFQSLDSSTVFDAVPIAEFANVAVDVRFSLSNTAYEFLDYVLLTVFSEREEEDPVTFRATLDEFTTNEIHSLSLTLPSTWTKARLELVSSTNSSSGSERFNLHGIRFVAHDMDTRMELAGDYDVDGTLEPQDLYKLDAIIARQLNLAPFDLDSNGRVDSEDRLVWIEQLWHSYVGDSNQDGLFDTADIVSVFQLGEYEDGVAVNSRWQSGDWNGDREFDTSDLVLAFQRGGYEEGPRGAARAVPEPSGLLLILTVVAAACASRRWYIHP